MLRGGGGGGGGGGGNAIQCTTVLGAIEGFDGAMVTVVINSYGP